MRSIAAFLRRSAALLRRSAVLLRRSGRIAGVMTPAAGVNAHNSEPLIMRRNHTFSAIKCVVPSDNGNIILICYPHYPHFGTEHTFCEVLSTLLNSSPPHQNPHQHGLHHTPTHHHHDYILSCNIVFLCFPLQLVVCL